MQERSSAMVLWIVGGALVAGVIAHLCLQTRRVSVGQKTPQTNRQVREWQLQVSGLRRHRDACRCPSCLYGKGRNGHSHSRFKDAA